MSLFNLFLQFLNFKICNQTWLPTCVLEPLSPLTPSAYHTRIAVRHSSLDLMLHICKSHYHLISSCRPHAPSSTEALEGRWSDALEFSFHSTTICEYFSGHSPNCQNWFANFGNVLKQPLWFGLLSASSFLLPFCNH